MATVSGVNYTLQTNTPVDLVLPVDSAGRVRLLYDTYEAAALATASTISWGVVPKGSRPVDFKLWHDDMGTTCTITLGDTLDPDRLLVATACSAAAGIIVPVVADIDKFGGYEYTVETIITSLTSGTFTGTMHLYLFYVMD